jgi:putative IMPACT (imprinted ancient) family translation regulator
MAAKTLACQYSQVDDILHLLKLVDGKVLTQDYQQQVIFSLAIPEANLSLMQEQLQTLSSGQLKLTAASGTN